MIALRYSQFLAVRLKPYYNKPFMKPAPFEYFAPDNLDAALELLDEHGPEAKVLAGGQSLIPAMNFRLVQPKILIDLNKITELAFIREDPSRNLHIGAMTRQSALERSAPIAARAPLLKETLPHIAHLQIRNRGTIGGSLAHADPAAELPVIAIALNAAMRLQSKTAERTVPAREFFQSMFTTALIPGEILVEVVLPAMPEGSGWAFIEFSRRRGDYALAGVAVVVSPPTNGDGWVCRMVFLNLGDGPVDSSGAVKILAVAKPGEKEIKAAADHAATHEIEPLGSLHATPEFQRHLARALTERALRRAFTRAGLPLND